MFKKIFTVLLSCCFLCCSVLINSGYIILAADPFLDYGVSSANVSVKFASGINSTWTTRLNNSIAAWNATDTPVTIAKSSSSSNTVYADYYSDTWYGLKSSIVSNNILTSFTIKINSRTITNDATNVSNFAQSTTVHEFGHVFWLCDNPNTTQSTIMSYSRDRNTMITPQQFDIDNVNEKF
ncbi:zinc metalloprotease [Anaeromicropila populeti]|uniref:Peptidase M10 metallopeptidase domain-containing protein n=1 Tax=Anaeromicropila populeti TaxID=37658 RepID=A0A1I6LRS6_9FIRM|nr:hypothetical protein [Anaeromicropila populeti]SFS06166.1 hypothetical protein SAMN05661086_03517 [Anaeromicropila populeti]